ncbi:MAG: cyclopropane-fatty-acyl-phospholipid synthase [Rhodospirillales bacterium]|nr:cyclopropane-fatty-acyl-phospholipid synthase [Rhodospirillales bacterium]
MRMLSNLLTRFIRNGQLRLIDAEGVTHSFGGQGPGPVVTLRIGDARVYTKIALNPELHAAEAYMGGTLTFEDGSDVGDFMTLFALNRSGLASAPSQQLLRGAWRGLKRWHQANPLGKAATNARHHYDLKTELYRLFLDAGLNYSCAFFEHPETDTLEQAQEAKLARITAKLAAQPGMVVAEIGSGWGSMAIHIAQNTGARVVAINVSPEQIRVARDRAEEAGVAELVEFRELDYRLLEGRFDRVVSVGMMEHVGIGNFDAYFAKIRDLLTDDGFAMVHCIGRMRPPGTTGPFIRKYIFPGGYVPSLSEVFAATERTGLWAADMEVLRLHYHYTLQHWRRRFAAKRAEAAALYDERFCRMWEWYLAAVDVGFENGSNMVFQLLLSRRIDAVPITRDYMMRRAVEPAAE